MDIYRYHNGYIFSGTASDNTKRNQMEEFLSSNNMPLYVALAILILSVLVFFVRMVMTLIIGGWEGLILLLITDGLKFLFFLLLLGLSIGWSYLFYILIGSSLFFLIKAILFIILFIFGLGIFFLWFFVL